MKLRPDTYVTLAVVSVGGYLLYKLLSKAGEAGDKATTTIAEWWVSLTSSAPVQVAGNMALPNGALVPLSQVQIKSDSSGAVFGKYAGIIYRLSPHDAQGNYPATRVS